MAIATRLQLFSDEEWAVLRKDLTLSPRQADIGKRICQGMSAQQIANDLGIRVPTVRAHLARLFRKFDVADRVELTLYLFMVWRARLHRDVRPRSAS
jgi:DNA-binding CsgD family transcriptional regulator